MDQSSLTACAVAHLAEGSPSASQFRLVKNVHLFVVYKLRAQWSWILNSPLQDYTHPNDQDSPSFDDPWVQIILELDKTLLSR